MLIDIAIQLGLGIVGFVIIVILFLAVVMVPVIKLGKLIYPDGDTGAHIAFGSIALLMSIVCGITIWNLGGWLLSMGII